MDTVRSSDPGRPADLASAESLSELALALHDESSLNETLELVLSYALSAVGCDYAGVVLASGRNRLETAAATNPMLYDIDEIRLSASDAPGLRALQDTGWVIVSDTDDEPRWPIWAAQISQLGIRSMLGARLSTTAATVGALVLYSRGPHTFDHDDRKVAELIARHAAVALVSARKVENLWLAVDARKLIGQAQGILMERYGLTADRAFAVLMRYSQDHNLKLREVARKLVSDGSLPHG